MANDSWAFLLSRNAYRSDIDELKTDITKDTELTNGNIALLSQRLDRIDANQTLITKALMQLSSPQADQFTPSITPPPLYATTGITST
jgi:predicted negative regulator of RcsB-dependent stress response